MKRGSKRNTKGDGISRKEDAGAFTFFYGRRPQFYDKISPCCVPYSP
jgi:hypothetical protein